MLSLFARRSAGVRIELSVAEFTAPCAFPRLERIRSLVASRFGGIEVSDMKIFLTDHSGPPASICRHEPEMITAASLIAEPSEGVLHAAVGNPCRHTYASYSM